VSKRAIFFENKETVAKLIFNYFLINSNCDEAIKGPRTNK